MCVPHAAVKYNTHTSLFTLRGLVGTLGDAQCLGSGLVLVRRRLVELWTFCAANWARGEVIDSPSG